MTDLENIRKALGNAIDYLKDNNLQLVGKELQAELVNAQKQVENLSIPVVVGQSEQLKAFADYAQKRMWEDGDKDLSEFVDEFLSL